MASVAKLAKRAVNAVDRDQQKAAIRKMKEKLDAKGKLHNGMYTLGEYGTHGIIGLASKQWDTLGPIPVAPDVALVVASGVVAALGKGKTQRAALCVARGAGHAILGRLVNTGFKVNVNTITGETTVETTREDTTEASRKTGRMINGAVEGAARAVMGNEEAA